MSTEPVTLSIGCAERVVCGSSSFSCCQNQCLRADVQQRVIPAAMRWVDADSAVDEHEASAKLLKGRRGHAPGVSSNVGSYEYSLVSLPDWVVDAAID